MKDETKTTKSMALFESREIRRTWHNGRWYFVVNDVVLALTDAADVVDYIKKMRQRDDELGKGWGQIVTPLSMKTKGGLQTINCADLEGIFRIIQSIPSPKAEPFKQWLARVGKERLDEIRDPELAVNRAKAIYERKGYPKPWIDKRMRGINVRNTLTDEWKDRGAATGAKFAILTDEIYKGTFDMTAQKFKEHKSLGKEQNLRDHMNDIELILTMLGEATTTKITTDNDSKGFERLQKDAKVGGEVAGRTRKDIEKQTKTKTISRQNYLQKNLDEL
ncbi:MAG: BRO family protein [Candidatus Taylorbacteria bacterium]|nr:BRO family protein [Candidatus Taylorbacteria bacterium]